ncbi:GNAT family N-acetyltransferase [Segeticoccus rhizosphaerae]|uniref:GNAT family N-acetyltransferase n=1 Tax=Segeticoccus rhizosphaerae TaxID=1104777 RepID=UPI00193A38BE|nr:GNAT family protein [Segeticoccus rhizosphaerae]
MPAEIETMDDVLVAARSSLRGDRVRLRELRDADLAPLQAWWRDPEVAVFNNQVKPQPDALVEEMLRGWSRNDAAGSAAFCIETLDCELVGHAALFGAEAQNRCATFGIFLDPARQGQGLGSDATRLMVRYGFETLGLHRIELSVNALNTRAVAAYEKAGFVREGLLREKLYYAGAFRDQAIMGVLAP